METKYCVKYEIFNEHTPGIPFLTNKSGDAPFEKWFNELENAEAFFNNEVAADEKRDSDIFNYDTLARHSNIYRKMTIQRRKRILL